MKINTIVDIGDRIWSAQYNTKRNARMCGFCGGTGLIEGKDGHEIDCPLCYDGRIGNDVKAKYTVWFHGRVENILINIRREQSYLNFITSGGDEGIPFKFSMGVEDPILYHTSSQSAYDLCLKLNKIGAPYPKSGSLGSEEDLK